MFRDENHAPETCFVPPAFDTHARFLDPAKAGAKLLRDCHAGHRDKRGENLP